MKPEVRKTRKTSVQSVGIQSIEVGVPLLNALANSDAPMSLTALATVAKMPLSQTHKYLASFLRVGFVVQFGRTGLYDLGPLALHLGLTALRRLSIFEIAQHTMNELRDELRTTVSLTVWGSHGPTVVRTATYVQSVGVSIAVGAVLPLLTSANGQIFAAFADTDAVREQMEKELTQSRQSLAKVGLQSRQAVKAVLEKVRRDHLAVNDGKLHPGLSALSTPIFDHGNSLVAALTLVSVPGTMELSVSGKPARMLLDKAAGLNERLGARAQKAHQAG